jgi:protein-S-isoprenylcysteine O-methyltransferase Ste14
VWPGALATGAVLAALGIALRMWAIATLGAEFASRLDAPRLVTRGPYRWLRHPSELGLALVTLGAGLVLGSPLALAAGAALIPLAIVRCRREDAALVRDHPAAYAAWRARRASSSTQVTAPRRWSRARSPIRS